MSDDASPTDPAARWSFACALSALDKRPIVSLSFAERHIILLRDGERVVAMGRACPHEGADLAKGRCADGKLYCPRHLAWFDLASGKVSPGWTFPSPQLYPLKIVDQDIWIAI